MNVWVPRAGFITLVFLLLRSQMAKRAARMRGYMPALRKRYRTNALQAYGGKCCQCGFSDPRALQFDHVRGGGCAELKKHGMKPSYYLMIMNDDTGKYQLLCANCNVIKKSQNRHEQPSNPNAGKTVGLKWCLPQWA